MDIIKGLYFTLTILAMINAISSLFFYWPRNKAQSFSKTDDENQIWIWKDTMGLIFVIISVCIMIGALLFLSVQYNLTVLWILMLLSHYLNMGTNIFPSATIIGRIVKGDLSGELSKNESTAIMMLVLTINYFNAYNFPNKIQTFANSLSNAILSDCILISFYVLSIFVCVFFCCSLLLNPIKMLVKVLRKICVKIPWQSINQWFTSIGHFANDSISTKTYTATVIEYSISCKILNKVLLWITLGPIAIFDVVKIIMEFIVKLFVSIIWYTYVIIKQIFELMIRFIIWLTSLEGRTVVAMSFRVAIILAFGFSVILNRCEPFLRNYEESTAILEFVSSSIIIPIIFEWILSYKKGLKSDTNDK